MAFQFGNKKGLESNLTNKIHKLTENIFDPGLKDTRYYILEFLEASLHRSKWGFDHKTRKSF